MVAEAIPEQAEAPTESQPSTPTADVAPEPSSIQEQAPVASGEEPPEPRGEVEEPPARPVGQLSPREQEEELRSLKAKALKEGLKPDEFTRQDQLEQAITQRRDNEVRLINDLTAKQNQDLQAITNRANASWSKVTELFDTDDPVLQELRDTRLNEFAAAAKDALTRHLLTQLQIQALQDLGDTPENRRAVLSYDDPVALAKEHARVLRQQLAAQHDPDKVVLSKAELEKAKRDYAKAELDKFKAANPGYVAPSVSNAKAANSGSYAWYMGLSSEERRRWASENPAEEQRIIREEMRRRSGQR